METLHPLFVHFPIVLVILAALSECTRRIFNNPNLEAVRFISWLALIGIVAAYWSGHEEFEELANNLSPELERAIGSHENSAKALLWIFPISVLFLELSIRADRLKWPIWGFRILLLVSVSLVFLTGLRGGELVYEHGLGTKLYQAPN